MVGRGRTARTARDPGARGRRLRVQPRQAARPTCVPRRDPAAATSSWARPAGAATAAPWRRRHRKPARVSSWVPPSAWADVLFTEVARARPPSASGASRSSTRSSSSSTAAPSPTGRPAPPLAVADRMLPHLPSKRRARLPEGQGAPDPDALEVVAIRAGAHPGMHIVGFDAPGESIELRVTARDRSAYVAGAILAADRLLADPDARRASPPSDLVREIIAAPTTRTPPRHPTARQETHHDHPSPTPGRLHRPRHALPPRRLARRGALLGFLERQIDAASTAWSRSARPARPPRPTTRTTGSSG